MRASSFQQNQIIARLESRNADLDRQLALSNAQEKNARATLRSAEIRIRALREEMTRLKGTVAQIRGQCANDIRRRDGEISRLKRHLEGRRGREGNGGQVGVVVINPGPPRSQQQSTVASDGCIDVASPDYSLKQETTEFLTQLSQGLSDENDALIGLVRSTLATLRSLQGLPLECGNGPEGSLHEGRADHMTTKMTAPPSYEELASDTDEVLEHLRGLLTNPSFVPLEEVEIREDEIIRLREGWEKMANRWKEAVAMMDSWRKRMVDTGDTINLDDLTKGMDLAAEIPAASESERHDVQAEEELSHVIDEKQEVVLDSPGAPSPVNDKDLAELAAEISSKNNVLRDRSGNARPVFPPRKVSFPGIPEENKATTNIGEFDDLLNFSSLSPNSSLNPNSSPVQRRSQPPMQVSRVPGRNHLRDLVLVVVFTLLINGLGIIPTTYRTAEARRSTSRSGNHP